MHRGENVTLVCNSYKANLTQINWHIKSFLYSFHAKGNKTFSNVTSHRLKVEKNSPLQLNVLDAQLNDTGPYGCTVTDRAGEKKSYWNLTVFEKPEGRSSAKQS